MADLHLTEYEQRCLEIIQEILASGHQPSILEVSKRMGNTKSAAQHHMTALREKGALRGPRWVGQWSIPRAGRKALEKRAQTA